MVQLDFQQREVSIKLVYYGPALSGKTTNLQRLHAHVEQMGRGRLMMLDTKDDRTLFFDLLPLHFRASGGVSIKLKLYTVPGQVMHNSTRKVVLQGVDGVVFVADSQISETQSNNESYANLKQNLREISVDPDEMPIVIQFNKRDLDDIRTDADIEKLARKGREPVYKATAIRGEGVLPTFLGAATLTWDNLDKKYDFTGKFRITKQEFLTQLSAHFGKKP
jgi:signal recognition particle receptor subunit beta